MFKFRIIMTVLVCGTIIGLLTVSGARADEIKDDINIIKAAKSSSSQLEDAARRLGKAKAKAAVVPLVELISKKKDVAIRVKTAVFVALGV